MSVRLIHSSPLFIADTAIGKCWDKPSAEGCINTERIERVANRNKHASTIEHLNYSFEIDMSRACLQEFARHRMASLSVKSSRYTLNELKNSERITYSFIASQDEIFVRFNKEIVSKFCILTGDAFTDGAIAMNLAHLQSALLQNKSNDIAKYCMPDAYKTSLVWTINARSLQNFLALRSSKAALWEIRDIANAIYKEIPEDHKFLFTDSLSK